jgi:hypothetical protein
MIKSIQTNGPFLSVAGGYPSATYISNGSGPGVGNMRYNPNSQNIEVFDGSIWVIMQSSNAYISLDHEAVMLLEWVRKKRDEDLEVERLAETNSTIKDLVNQVKEKQEQIRIVQALVKEEVKV